MLDEKLLKIFISVVYAKLFEAVCVEIFKAEDVQNADGTARAAPGLIDCAVDFLDNEDKQPAVDTLDESIAYVNALIPR